MARPLAQIARICLFSLLAGSMPAGPAGAQDAADDERFRLGPGDVILVNVLEDPELDAQALILPDGRISLPVAGTIRAGGRTPDGLARLISARLRNNFVRPPSVTVSVTSVAQDEEDEEEIETAEVYVLGEVARPGRYEYETETPLTVIKALTLAGGLGPFAARSRIQVRENEGEIETLRLFDYAAFEDGRIATAGDLTVLRDGAVIVVPERGLFE